MIQGSTPAGSARRTTDETRFLASYDPAAYAHPTVAVDVVLLTVYEGALRCLVTRRGEHPFRDHWALPGVIVGMDESLDDAAGRALRDEGSVEDDTFLEQLYTFGAPDRDPRTRVITVAYYALVPPHRVPAPDTLARVEVPWPGETGGSVELHAPTHDDTRLAMAFDHEHVAGLAVQRIRGKLNYTPIGFELLPATFPLRALQVIHETILGRRLNKDSFRRRVLNSGIVIPTGRRETGVTYRPAALYRFAHANLDTPEAPR